MSKQEVNQQDQMLRGTLWLTIGNFSSRLMGAVYIIPWYLWMGQYAAQANALFNMGYNIYAMFLLMSTVGINVAVAKQISKYNSMGKPELSFKLVRAFLLFMLVLGLVFTVIMYLGASIFAQISGGGNELIPVIHSLSLAVLIFPAMSVMRGVFQGFNNMKPYAISQVAEQLIRVIWMLLTTYFIMKMGSKDYVSAVVQSTFAAFIGMLVSVSVLIYYLWRADLLKPILQKSETAESVDSKSILLETLKEAVPFIITGSAIQIFQLIDQFTFINSMHLFTDKSQTTLKVLFSYFSANPNKIIMILIAVAAAIGGVGIPLLTENFVKKDKSASAKLVVSSLTMLLVFLLPAVFGATVLAKPLYAVFYGIPDKEALGLFVVAMLETILLGLYTVLSPMIQALFENRNAITYFFYGTLVKLILQLPLIFIFQAYGPLIATAFGLAVPIVLMYRRICSITGFSSRLVINRSLLIALQTGMMLICVFLSEALLNQFYPVTDRTSSVIHLIVSGAIGVASYSLLSLMTHSIDFVIGKNKAQSLRKKLKFQ